MPQPFTPSRSRPLNAPVSSARGATATLSSGRSTPVSSHSKTGSTSSQSSIRSTPSSGRTTPVSSISSRSTPTTPTSKSSTSSLLGGSTHKKYHAPLSHESRSRTKLSPIKASPTRPTSRSGSRSPMPPRSPGGTAISEMDVSKIDPERVLVDSHTVDVGDSSFDAADIPLSQAAAAALSSREKVKVAIRIKPSNGTSSWIVAPNSNSIELAGGGRDGGEKKWHFNAIHGPSATNKDVYLRSARELVWEGMKGFNTLLFAYGQTSSGKSHTMHGCPTDEGVVGRSMKEVFWWIKNDPTREYLLRISYLEIYNETIIDLLAPPGEGNLVNIVGAGNDTSMVPLREECITGLSGVSAVLQKGEANRRTACTDWNDRSSRSHSVFRLVVESRERGSGGSDDDDDDDDYTMKSTHSAGARATHSRPNTPGISRPQTPGGTMLTSRGESGVRCSVLSLIDLAGSEKATSDKARTREGKYINTSLLTLSHVISTLANNSQKGPGVKHDHVPYRNSKLTRLLWGSLAGNARISVICTINPDPPQVSESISTVGFAKRVGGVKLNAQRKEIISTDALIERYRKEIDDLKERLVEKEVLLGLKEEVQIVPAKGRRSVSSTYSSGGRRLSAKEKLDSTTAMTSLNARIHQLTQLILTSESTSISTSDSPSSDSSTSSPSSSTNPHTKVGGDLWTLEPYQLQQELLGARMEIERRDRRVKELESAIDSSSSSSTAPGSRMVASDTAKTLVNGEANGVVPQKEREEEQWKLVLVGTDTDVEKWKAKYEDLEQRFTEKIGSYTAKWTEKEKKWNDREAEYRAQLSQTFSHDELLKSREAELASKTNELAGKTADVEQKDRLLEEKELQFSQMRNEVERMEEEVVKLRKEMQDKDSALKLVKKKAEEETTKREEKDAWAGEVGRELEKEKKIRQILENERKALAAFVTKFDALAFNSVSPADEINLPTPALLTSTGPNSRRSSLGSAASSTVNRPSVPSSTASGRVSLGGGTRPRLSSYYSALSNVDEQENESPVRLPTSVAEKSLLDEKSILGSGDIGELSFEEERDWDMAKTVSGGGGGGKIVKDRKKFAGFGVLGRKNIFP